MPGTPIKSTGQKCRRFIKGSYFPVETENIQEKCQENELSMEDLLRENLALRKINKLYKKQNQLLKRRLAQVTQGTELKKKDGNSKHK